MTEGLKNFATHYNIAINDPKLLQLYRMEEDSTRDIATMIVVAEDRQKIKDAKGFKAKGYDISDIAEVTGLSIDEIKAL